jgi:hypothetical protein
MHQPTDTKTSLAGMTRNKHHDRRCACPRINTTTMAPTTTTEKPTTTTEAPKSWKTVMTLSGNANKRSGLSALGAADTRMRYVCGSGQFTLCGIYVMQEGTSLEKDGGFPEVTADKPGSGETLLVKDAGKYYLDVASSNSNWTVKIEQLR